MIMKVAICALAKNENAYIDEWVRYHIDLGYDRIYLFDNNDPETPFVGDFISPDYRDRVEIQAVQGDYRIRQFVVYNQWIKEHTGEYDWCSFIDIDEFVVTSKNSIKDLLATMPDDCRYMILTWQMFGDDDIVEGDESRPVRERITQRQGTADDLWNRMIKTTVRCNDATIRARHSHSFRRVANGEVEQPICHNCYGVPMRISRDGMTAGFGWHTDHYIAHYSTKTIAEFLKYKVRQIGFWRNSPLRYFWRFNTKTPEKLAYIEQYKAQHGCTDINL